MVEAITGSAEDGHPADAIVLLSLDTAGRNALAELKDGTIVVANADTVPAGLLPASAVTFGLGEAAALQATDLDATLDGTSFVLTSDGRRHPVHLRVLGEHHVMNALAALTVAAAIGVPPANAI